MMEPKIIVAGLGPADLGQITLETWEALQTHRRIVLRTEVHPSVQALKARHIAFETCDAFYETCEDFQQVYEAIVAHLLEQTKAAGHEGEELLYCVPGHPMVAEETVQRLLQEAPRQGVQIEILSAMSFLDPVFTALGIDPARDGFAVLDALRLPETLPLQCRCLYTQVYSRLVASDLKLSLLETYPPDQPVTVVFHAGESGKEKLMQLPLAELDFEEIFDHLTSVYVPALKEGAEPAAPEETKGTSQYPLDPLVHVFEHLLAPDGCPWDREQTHASLKQYLLEETYEVMEAIDLGDMALLQEELGDVLMQVVFHGALAQGRGDFDCNYIIRDVTEKLIRRHPHVFGEVHVDHARQVSVLWEQIKSEEKKNGPQQDKAPQNLYGGLPALLMASEYLKLKKKLTGEKTPAAVAAAEQVDMLWQKLQVKRQGEGIQEEDLGDFLFASAVLGKACHLSPETALVRTIQKMSRNLVKNEAYL